MNSEVIVEESDCMPKGLQFMATDYMPESDLSVNGKVIVEESESVSSLQNTLSEIVLRVS